MTYWILLLFSTAFLSFGQNSFGQTAKDMLEVKGFSKTCNKDTERPYITSDEFTFTETRLNDTIRYTYYITNIYTAFSKTDTVYITWLMDFCVKDSSLTLSSFSRVDTTSRTYAFLGSEVDSMVKMPCLRYAYDNADDPDNQIFYSFNPSYGIIKIACPAWWWYTYYYREDLKLVSEIICK